jgi:hypothetical protein
MTDLRALEARVQAIEDVEAVKKTMYRYWRCLDDKRPDEELRECFTEDVVGDYGMPGWQANGRDALLRFLTPERRPAMQLSHGGHNAEVELIDAHTARGHFRLHDWVTDAGRTTMRGFGAYDVAFVKQAGAWRIRRLDLRYQYREEHHLFVENVNLGFGEVQHLER